MEEVYAMHSLHGEVMAVPEAVTPTRPTSDSQFPQNFFEMQLAQAYVRPQPLECVFSPAEGLRHGTAFPNLSQPYMGRVSWKPC